MELTESTAKQELPACPVETTLTLIGGYSDGTIRPNGNITRGEIAKILALF